MENMKKEMNKNMGNMEEMNNRMKELTDLIKNKLIV
jgi:hypothetical protein